MSAEIVKEGYLMKTGSADKGQFRKRWFILDNEKLMYFKKQLVSDGRVFIYSHLR